MGFVGTGATDVAGNAQTNEFWAYDPIANGWSAVSPLPGPARVWATGFAINGKGYVTTGVGSGGSDFRDNWAYDPTTDQWTAAASFTGPERFGAIGFALAGKGFVGSGWQPFQAGFYKDFYAYNPTTDSWGTSTDMPNNPDGVANAVAATLNDTAYIAGGFNSFNADFWQFVAAPPAGSIAGTIRNTAGLPVATVTLTLSDGTTTQTATTGAGGSYALNNLPSANYTATPGKAVFNRNGLNVFDYIDLLNHVNNAVLLNTPYKIIAADVNQSGTVNSADAALLLDYVTFRASTLPQAWRFVAASYTFTNPASPLGEAFPEANTYSALSTDLVGQDFIGVKVGDVNEDADPQQ